MVSEAAPQDLRERRKQQTRTTLVKLARKFTNEHGLAGFTLDELCTAAGISRRTFFNHFASKDDAVLGMPKHSPFESFSHDFIASKGAITLAEALTELTSNVIETMIGSDFAPEKLMGIIHKEPSLVNRMRHNGIMAGIEVEKLICEREGLTYPNPYANTVAFVSHHLTMSSIAQMPQSEADLCLPPQAPRDKESFIEHFTGRLQHIRDFLNEAEPTPSSSTPSSSTPN